MTVSISYSFYLKNPLGEPTSYGGCYSHDVMIRRYNELSNDKLTGKSGVIVIKNTTTTVSEDITELIKQESVI